MSSKIYSKLSGKLGFPLSEYLPRILEKMFTPEEGELILELNTPINEVARKLDMHEEKVKRKIEELRIKGIIWPPGEVWPGMEGFFFGPVFEVLRAMYLINAEKFLSAESLKEYMDMLKEFYKAEWCEDQGKYYGEHEHFNMRVLPARKAFEHTPEISPDRILPEEDSVRVLKNAEALVVIPCVCKMMWQTCDAPVEVCIQLDKWAENTLSRGAGRRISVEEALVISDRAEEAGLIHTMPIHASNVMCNCCSDCCIVIDPARKWGTLSIAMTKSHYCSVIDQDSCIGCEECFERCPFDAIEMKQESSSKKPKATVDSAKCYGCGVCAVACPPEAITMKLVDS